MQPPVTVSVWSATSGLDTVREATRTLSLRSNLAWTVLGNSFYAGCQWGILIAVAKLGSPEMVGQFALALAVTAPVFMLTNLQLRSAQATDTGRAYDFGEYLALRLVTTLCALVIVVAIPWVAGYARDTALVIVAFGVAKAFEAVSDVFYGLLQQREQMDRIAVSMMLKGVLSLAVLVAAIRVTGQPAVGAAALALVWAGVLVAYDARAGLRVLGGADASRDRLRPCWSPRVLARLARLTAPLGVSMMLITLNLNIPRYFIEHYLGRRELGVFASMAYLMVVGTTVVNAMGQAATPRLASHFARGERAAFWRLLGLLGLVGAGIGLATLGAATLFGYQILSRLYRPEYAQRLDVFRWLMLAATAGYVGSVFGYGLTATRAFYRLPLVSLAVTVCAVASGALIPKFGLLGAAWSLCVINTAMCVLPIIMIVGVENPTGPGRGPRD